MGFGRLPYIFFWKNLLYLRFNCLALTVLFSGCLGIILVYLKSTYQPVSCEGNEYESKNFDILKQLYFPANDDDGIYYASNDAKVNTLMEDVRLDLEITQNRFFAFDNALEMRLMMEHNCIGNCFGIEFQHIPEKAEKDDTHLQYSISSNKMRILPKKQFVNDDDVNGNKDDDEYIRIGFLTLQHVIDKQYLKMINNNLNFELQLISMPTIDFKHMGSDRLLYFGVIFSLLFAVLLLSTFLVPFVEEKQNGLKEFLIIATPLNFLNGLTFFLVRFVVYLIFLMIIFIAASQYAAFGTAPLIYVFILFVLYMIATMIYVYLISVCFNSVFYAKVGGLLLLIVPYIFYMLEGTSSVATYIFSTKTFMEGLDVFQTFTNKHRDFNFLEIFNQIKNGSFQMFSIYIILILQSLFYALLYLYLSNVFPGDGGLKKSYLYFLKAEFYKKHVSNLYTTTDRGEDAIIIQDLVKKFKTPRREINISDRLNMVIKNNQITVLLGHNGAGKTTTLNMIMGSVPKDSGKIIVCSERDVSSYRHLIGFCPQHSIFIHYMTCIQHLQFFAQLRGMSEKDSLGLAHTLLEELKLTAKEHEYGRNLSGGMKRRLSLGIALSGDTKVVVLDEPSSGLDIESRREIWNILLELRKKKAILVTTHYMEEAEILGDTICILANGRVQRSGSPLELKRKAGSGYILKLCTEKDKYQENETLNIIRVYIPSAYILNIVPPNVSISLPYSHKNNYSKMLLNLEDAQEDLGITSISITDTSLEDVFLNCAAEIDQVDSPANIVIESSRVPYERLNDIHWYQQSSAIVYKKITYLRNEWRYALLMLLLPFFCTGIAIILMHSMSIVTNTDVLPINLKHMREGLIYIYNPTNQNDKFERILIREIESYDIATKKLELNGNNSLVDELKSLQMENLADFLQNVIGVIDLSTSSDNGDTITIYNSGNIYHSSVVLVNLIDTVFAKTISADNGIDATYIPIRRFISDISPARLEYYAVIVSIGMFFSMFFYVTLPFHENQSGFKEIQPIPRHIYWLSTYCCDISLHFVVCILLFIVQKLIMPSELYGTYEQWIIITSIFFYGCSYLPILYSFANSFHSISTVSTYLLFMLTISAITPFITSSNIQAMMYHETKIIFLSLLPDFNLNHQLRIVNEHLFAIRHNHVASTLNSKQIDQMLSAENQLNFFTFFIEASFVSIFTMFVLIFVLENKYKRNWIADIFNCYKCRRLVPISQLENENEEAQCAEEKSLVMDIINEKSEADYPLIVNNLYKSYNCKLAVRGLNFAVKKQECFGLLGVNGAGKTSTFQMIAANNTITDGTIKINGIDIRDNETQYRYRFGYCPQHDSLSDFMTAYQVLKYMAMLRGLTRNDTHNEVMYWLEELNLENYSAVQIRHYSGGTKRKTLAALAMIGSPSLVLLDEPTTGVDPVSRRFLWKCIQDFQKRNKTIVLTSHSMDECEHLCNRLAIMVDGKFKCLDAITKLKLRYGSGFTINVKMKSAENCENLETITEEMINQFPGSRLREYHAGMLKYYVKNCERIAWSNVFKRTEKFMLNCADIVEDYSLNESTLEDIFLKFDNERFDKKLDNGAFNEEV